MTTFPTTGIRDVQLNLNVLFTSMQPSSWPVIVFDRLSGTVWLVVIAIDFLHGFSTAALGPQACWSIIKVQLQRCFPFFHATSNPFSFPLAFSCCSKLAGCLASATAACSTCTKSAPCLLAATRKWRCTASKTLACPCSLQLRH